MFTKKRTVRTIPPSELLVELGSGRLRFRSVRQIPRKIAILVATMALIGTATVALAVHDETFQLEGDAIASTTTAIGGSTQTVDWSSIFTTAGAPVASLPTDFADAGFKRDFQSSAGAAGGTFITKDTSTYATGSKDTLPISGWQCNQDNNVNSKIDVMNAYTVSYTVPSGPDAGDEIIYFALERNTNTGTADVGFWFLQSAVGCESTGSAVTFSGAHTDGDVLVVSEFTNGGVVSVINVYRWDGGANGSLNPNSIGVGVDCRSVTLGTNDPVCGASNRTTNGTGGTITTPWLTSNFKDGVAHSLRTSEFFEGGINLTDLQLGGQCFSSFIGDTRSSTSLTATLFDFATGPVSECSSGITTTPQAGDGTAVPATIDAAARVAVRDHAEIEVNGFDGSFGGTVTFSLCGPLALNTTTNCATGGVQIGSPVTVTGTAGVASLNGPTATLTSVGRYCWRAVYTGDATAGVPGSTDPAKSVADGGSTSECFSIGPKTPTLTTTASADVTLGTAITDTASLTGTAKQPGTGGLGGAETIAPGSINALASTQAPAGGTITWTLKGPDDCDDAGLTLTGATATVSGDNASYGPVSATPTQIGKYTFVASYNGSSPNTTGAGPSSCPPAAGDGDEEVTVTGQAAFSTEQNWLPNDEATLTGPTALSGTLTFTLYPTANCTGTLLYTKSITVSGAASGTKFSTDNTTTFIAKTSGSFSWLVSYNDNSLGDPPNSCKEDTSLTIDNVTAPAAP